MNGKIKWSKILFIIFTSLFFVSISACNTTGGDEAQLAQVSGSPAGADTATWDETGTEVFNRKIPSSVTQKRGTGRYWGANNYDVIISLVGYHSQSVRLTHESNGWNLADSLVKGGASNYFVIDPFIGKIYKLAPEAVNATTPANATSEDRISRDTITISLISEVPEELLGKLVQVK